MLLRFPCLFTKLLPTCEKQSAFIQMCKLCLENITPFHQCHLFNVNTSCWLPSHTTAHPSLSSPAHRSTFWDLGLTQCL